VYAARDPATGERVAVKLVHGLSRADLLRFRREAEALAKLRHPGIVRCVDHGTAGGAAYLAMEWLDGEDLRSRLWHGPLPVWDVVALGRRVAEALAALHRHGLVHRDLKPGNIVLRGGRAADAVLVDFGLVRAGAGEPILDLMATGTVVGTPSYMAPEQARGLGGDAQADVFSLGCVLYRCLTGRTPFDGKSVAAVLAKVLLEEPPRVEDARPDVPGRLAGIVHSMIEKEPAFRPAGAAAAAALATLEVEAEGSGERHARVRVEDIQMGAMGVEDVQSAAAFAEGARGAATGAEGAWGAGLGATGFAEGAWGETASTDESPTGVRRRRGRARAAVVMMLAGAGSGLPERVRAIAGAHGGRVDALIEGTLVVTLDGGGLVADEAAAAAELSLALRAAHPSAAMAIATARPGGAETLGDAIDRAALLLLAARRGKGQGQGQRHAAALDDATAALLDPRFEVAAASGGLALVAVRDAEAPARTLLGRVTPMFGRERELREIEALFRDCVDEPAARALLVTGPAGAGKSRLAHEAVSALRREVPEVEVWWGRGEPLRRPTPLGVLAGLVRSAAALHERDPAEGRRGRILELCRARLSARNAPWVAEILGEVAGAPFPEQASPALAAARRDPQVMAERIAEAWSTFVDATSVGRPLVVVLNDAQWADAPSLRLVAGALGSLRHRPWLVVALARPEAREVLPGVFAGLGLQEIELGPLPSRASAELARSVLGDTASAETIERVAALSEGNALHLGERIRAIADARRRGVPEPGSVLPGTSQALPGTALGVVQARVRDLDAGARRVLAAASVFGEAFWPSGVAELLGEAAPERGLAERDGAGAEAGAGLRRGLAERDGAGAEASAVLRRGLAALAEREMTSARSESRFAGEAEMAFRHLLVREAAYATLAEAERARFHGIAARWLIERGERDPMVLAQHLEIAGERGRAAELLAEAARRALVAGDVAAAIELGERAIEDLPEGQARIACLSLLGEAHVWTQGWARAEAIVAELGRTARAGSEAWLRAMWIRLVGAFVMGRLDGLVEALGAIAASEPAPGAEARAVAALAVCTLVLSVGGQLAGAREAVRRIEALRPRAEAIDPGARGWAELAATWAAAWADGDPWAARQHALAACAAFERAHVTRHARLALSFLAMAEWSLGLLEEAQQQLRAIDDGGDVLLVWLKRRYQALVLVDLGAFEEARALAEAHREAARASGSPSAFVRDAETRWMLGEMALREGDLRAAGEHLAAALEGLRVTPLQWPWAACALAKVRRAEGRPEEALALAREAAQVVERQGGTGQRSNVARVAYAEMLDAAGQREAAREALRGALEFLRSRADRIEDAEVRRRFLTTRSENARALELAAEWGVVVAWA
jgi:tetratricopeptide (TPR) repeat protein